MRRWLSAVVVCLLLGCPGGADAKWTLVQSENFVFVGDASEGQIRRVASRLEQFRETLLRALPGARGQSPVPTVVLVFATDRSMTPVKPLFRGNPIEILGYFQGGEDVNYIAVNAERFELSVLATFHEYAHFLVSNTQGRLPVWVSEGLAEFYELTETQDGGRSVVIGRAPKHHVDLLTSSTLMPVKELIGVDHQASIYNEGRRRGVLYAQSWALVHYLTLGHQARGVQFRTYLAALRAGTPDAEAFATAFGADAAALDRELFEYVRRFAFPAVRIEFAERSAALSIPRGTTLADEQADAYVADLQARIGRIDDARARVAAIRRKDPNVGRAAIVLGGIELRADRLTEALVHLEQGAAQAADDFIVQSLYGRGLVTAMSAARNDRDAAAALLPKARAVLQRATMLDPRSARAAWMLAYVELVGGGDVAAAVTALERATALDPGRDEYRMLLAQALLRQDAFERVVALLGPLLAAGRTAETREEARRLMAATVERRAARAAGAAASAPLAAPPPAADAGLATAVPPDPAPPAPRDDVSRLSSLGAGAERASGLLLRLVLPGEQRVLGTFEAIDCENGAVALRVAAAGRVLRLRTRQLADVDFISYRSSQPGVVSCGPQTERHRVYATYVPDAAGSGPDNDGIAVAIEVLPDGFVPANRPS